LGISFPAEGAAGINRSQSHADEEEVDLYNEDNTVKVPAIIKRVGQSIVSEVEIVSDDMRQGPKIEVQDDSDEDDDDGTLRLGLK